jgi:universal stress protein E
MKRFQNILAFVNGPDAVVSLHRAIQLAEDNQAKLTAIDVLRPPSSLFEAFSGRVVSDGLREDVVQQREDELQAIVAERAGSRVRFSTKVFIGTPYIEIIRQVLRGGHDLVVKTAEGRSLFSQRAFGGTALNIMRQCPCPVWIVKPEHDRQLKRILAAVDVEIDADTPRHAALNTNILQIASSMAELEGAELHIIHAWSVWAENILKSRIPADEFHDMVQEQEKATAQALETLLEPFKIAVSGPQVHLLHGPPDYVIPQVVHDDQIELLVMGTVCRTGIPGFMIGNTAENILSGVDCSVLTLKPDGFQSPITLTD